MDVKEAFISRRSVRRFLPDPIPKDKIKNILECSAFAPSGHNIQPWHVYVVEGKKKEAITKSILGSIEDGSAKNFKQEFDYYPTEWFEPFVSRRRAVGFELYKLLNIGRDDFEAIRRWRRPTASATTGTRGRPPRATARTRRPSRLPISTSAAG